MSEYIPQRSRENEHIEQPAIAAQNVERERELMGLPPMKRAYYLHDCLQSRYDALVNKHSNQDEMIRQQNEKLIELAVVKRGKLEMFINFTLATLFMFIGSILVGCYPKQDGKFPIQFIIGTVLVILSFILGWFTRALALIIYYKLFQGHKQ